MKLTFLAVVVFVVATMFGIVEAEQGEQRDLRRYKKRYHLFSYKSYGGNKYKSYGGNKYKPYGGNKYKSYGGNKYKSYGGNKYKSHSDNKYKPHGGDLFAAIKKPLDVCESIENQADTIAVNIASLERELAANEALCAALSAEFAEYLETTTSSDDECTDFNSISPTHCSISLMAMRNLHYIYKRRGNKKPKKRTAKKNKKETTICHIFEKNALKLNKAIMQINEQLEKLEDRCDELNLILVDSGEMCDGFDQVTEDCELIIDPPMNATNVTNV